MSGFKEPMQETNSGLLDLEVLLHIANSLKALQSEHILPTRKDFQARLRDNEVLRQQGGGILTFDGRSAVRMESVIDPLEATRGCRLEHVSQDVLLAAEPLRGDVVCLRLSRKKAQTDLPGSGRVHGISSSMVTLLQWRMVLGTVFPNLEKHEFGDKLVLHFRERKYRFRHGRVAGKEDSRRKMKGICERSSELIEK